MSKWIEEELEPGLRVMYGLKEQLRSSTSKFQTVDVVDLEPFGRTLLIDGLIQSCQVDEFVYHESLVHPALLSHPCPKSVYIGGGGEGSTAREVLRHSTVERCVMVDIDEDVVSFCRENLPENSEAFKDSRLELVIDDAKAVLEQSPTGFDIIIMDLDDPLEGGPCYQLYTVEVSARGLWCLSAAAAAAAAAATAAAAVAATAIAAAGSAAMDAATAMAAAATAAAPAAAARRCTGGEAAHTNPRREVSFERRGLQLRENEFASPAERAGVLPSPVSL